ncbi:MAG: indole-3-glycerol phosphate synthase [Candidatus Azotimanducaceae bacterium]|jgi:indole-3-glycerol phosphate synthase
MAIDILEKIVAVKRSEVAISKQNSPQSKLEKIIEVSDPVRKFKQHLLKKKDRGEAAVIAEIKKASPSKGVIREFFDPVSIAHSYENAGASCLSILTDVTFFQGCDEYLVQARAAVDLPVLRKDFIIDEYQIFEARSINADCILLIVSILDDKQLASYHALAKDLSMDVLVEVHNEIELQRALLINPDILGINNRNLRTFEVSLDTTRELKKLVSTETLIITESGIHTRADVRSMLDEDICGFLVGEAFMREPNPGEKLQEIFGV